MGELLHFCSKRAVRCIPQSGRTVCLGPGNCDQNIGLRPIAFTVGVLQLGKIDFELTGTLPKGLQFITFPRRRFALKPYNLFTRTPKGITHSIERYLTEKPLSFSDMNLIV